MFEHLKYIQAFDFHRFVFDCGYTRYLLHIW